MFNKSGFMFLYLYIFTMKEKNEPKIEPKSSRNSFMGISEEFDSSVALERRRFASITVFFLLLAIYISTSYSVTVVARSQNAVLIGSRSIPIASFAGVVSSIGNICIIFLVVFFKKRGLIISLILLILQFPLLIRNMFLARTVSSIPGVFSNLLTITAIIIIYRRNRMLEIYQEKEIENLKKQHKLSQHLFEQTATALVNAVDAKDTYSHGHSLRVAEYSEKIARLMGKSEDECNKIYYTALLHDVGKIGIPDTIITKDGKLTKEEYEVIKQHPEKGNQILQSISEYPYLSIGAHYHHERYDGKGYPEGLKGEDIPEIARIISVADAYDAMTSNRSYRSAIPQQLVREEIVKNSGTQFDPEIAKVMQQLIDIDVQYRMKERDALRELAGNNELYCTDYRSVISDGIVVTPFMTKIHLKFTPKNKPLKDAVLPSIILFDSLDARVHDEEKTIKDLLYYEYCNICFDGTISGSNIRKSLTNTVSHEKSRIRRNVGDNEIIYNIDAVKYKDHVLIRIDNGEETTEVTVVLPDSSRFAYIGLTGEHCDITDVTINKAKDPVPEDYITRIAEEISYIDGPVGDIPNVQVDGHRTASSDGIPVTDGMQITFHSKSLPTARLIWHCPYIELFHSDDKKVRGANYKEYILVRLDGEDWEYNEYAHNRMIVNRTDEFINWDAWKKAHKEGIDCTVTFKKDGNKITVSTENLGLSVKSVTEVLNEQTDIYAALTGDQCAITDIKIIR